MNPTGSQSRFGVKYWSHEALQNMKGVLPRDAVSGALPE